MGTNREGYSTGSEQGEQAAESSQSPRSSGERGQTAQDYVVGITVLLLTLSGVFAFVPTVFGITEDPVERNAHTQADELASQLVSEYRVGETETTLSAARLEREVDGGPVPADLQTAAGIQRNRVNVRITADATAAATPLVESGESVPETEPTATVSRFVRLSGDRCGSDGVCQLVVRVW